MGMYMYLVEANKRREVDRCACKSKEEEGRERRHARTHEGPFFSAGAMARRAEEEGGGGKGVRVRLRHDMMPQRCLHSLSLLAFLACVLHIYNCCKGLRS